jgi:hypothetical protein
MALDPQSCWGIGPFRGISNVGLYGPGDMTDARAHRSYLSHTRANVWINIWPNRPEHLAFLAGCEVEDLPELLEHWKPHVDTGNTLLNSSDPLDQMVGNPWRALTFRVSIGVSWREWKRMSKELGQDPEAHEWCKKHT